MNTHILMINCPDETGLIFRITGVLFNHKLNIISNDEFVERESQHFFMRTEVSGEFDEEKVLRELYTILPESSEIKLSDNRKKNIVILVTKEYHCLSDLLARHSYNDLNANILAVISNYPVLQKLTDKFGVPFYYLDHSNKNRQQFEEEMISLLQQFNPEFLILAKYMRILSPAFVSRFNNRIVNIHHSFLPAFVGANPYQKAYERGVKIIGATAHFVNDELDQGPIISQNVIPVSHTHNAREMAQAGRDVEKNVLANSLHLVFNERVFVYKNKTIIFD